MRRPGEFSEFWADPSWPSVRDAREMLTEPVRRRAGVYLAQGETVRFTMERVSDVLDGEEVFLSAALRTDGEWYWRSDLAHYVLKYGVELAPDLIENAASNLWTSTALDDERLTRIAAAIRVHERGPREDAALPTSTAP